MKLVITVLMLALSTTVISHNVNQLTKTQQEKDAILYQISSINTLKNNHNNLLWYVKRHEQGCTPFYNIDFNRKFFVASLAYLEELKKVLNKSNLINEKTYNDFSSSILK